MDKNSILNVVLKNIIDSDLVNCVFTDELIRDNTSLNINIYCVTSKEKFPLFFKYSDSFFTSKYNIIHIEKDIDKIILYYECGIILKIFVKTSLDFDIYTNVYSLYDPAAFLTNFKIKTYALKNSELAKLIDAFSGSLINYYNNKLLNDNVESYKLSKDTLDIFTIIYRGFYDSLNAKKKYKDLDKTMNNTFLNRLLEIIVLTKLGTENEAISLMIREMDIMVSKLPVNIVALFNIDFYNYAKNLISML